MNFICFLIIFVIRIILMTFSFVSVFAFYVDILCDYANLDGSL